MSGLKLSSRLGIAGLVTALGLTLLGTPASPRAISPTRGLSR